MNWNVIAESGISTKKFDDELLVYHGPSGNTHRLNKLGSELFALILAGSRPMDVEALKIQSAHKINFGSQTVENILQELCSNGLIRLVD